MRDAGQGGVRGWLREPSAGGVSLPHHSRMREKGA